MGAISEAGFPGLFSDPENAIKKLPALDFAGFNLGLALLSCGREAEALAAYERASRQFPDKIEALALTDLEQAKGKWLSPERAQPVVQLLHTLMPPFKR